MGNYWALLLALFVSFTTAVLSFFDTDSISGVVQYGIINPLVLLVPRLWYRFHSGLRTRVNKEWVTNIEVLGFFIILLNSLGSLFFHRMGIQYDRLLHYSAAFLAALIFFSFLSAFFSLSRSVVITFIVTCVGLFLWEGLQYSSDVLFNTHHFYDVVQEIRVDFWEDIFFGFFGVLTALLYLWLYYGKQIRTHLHLKV